MPRTGNRDLETPRRGQRPRGDRTLLNRRRGDSTRESRGPETSRYLEDDTSSVGREGARRPRNRAYDEFDDDLVR